MFQNAENPEVREAFISGVLEGRRQSRLYMYRTMGLSEAEISEIEGFDEEKK